jgi:hypothetical protein
MNLPSLDFTNWREHPSDNRYNVFFFKTLDESQYFENLLTQNKIWFEANIDEDEPTYKYYFAVNKLDTNAISTLNNLTIGQYRKPLIENAFLRYGLIIGMLIIMTLAVIGYLKAN